MDSRAAHIFVDNSNVIGGARGKAEQLEPTTPWVCIRTHFDNLFDLIEGDYLPSTRFLSGSKPPANDELWNYARKRGYETALLTRIWDVDRSREQAVDEQIHLKIANTLIKHVGEQQRLILVTGDGQEGEFGTSFVRYLRTAIQWHWDVEIWSWERQLSPNLSKLTREQLRPDQCQVFVFDSLYMRLTFSSGNGKICYKGTETVIRDRRVRPLEPDDRARCRIA